MKALLLTALEFPDIKAWVTHYLESIRSDSLTALQRVQTVVATR